MKYILTALFLVSFVAYGQEPAYTPMRLNYQFRGIKVDSLFLIPSFVDTNAANNSTMKNVAGSMIRTGNDFWMRNSTTTAWLQNVNVGSGSSTSVQFVDSVWRIVGKDSIFWRKGGVTSKIKDSTAGRLVDTIYRTAGKDSIFFKIAGTTYKIKDSSGSLYAGDSPDRINGTATNNVNAQMGLWQMRFNGGNAGAIQGSYILDSMAYMFFRSDSIVFGGYNTGTADFIFKNLKTIKTNSVDIIDMTANSALALGSVDSTRITSSNKINISKGYIKHLTEGNKYEFKDFNNTFLRIDTLGNFEAGDLTKDSLNISLLKSGNEIVLKSKATPLWKEQNYGITMYLKVTRGVNGIDLSTAGYSSRVPGVYVIATASGNDFSLPEASDWPGQTLTIINNDGGNAGNLICSDTMFDRGTGNTINSIQANEMIIFVSDGSDWYGAIQ